MVDQTFSLTVLEVMKESGNDSSGFFFFFLQVVEYDYTIIRFVVLQICIE